MLKVFAGYGVALAAVLYLMLSEFWATSYYVAVFGSGKAASAVCNFASLLLDTVRVSQVSFADAAVHTAGRYEFSLERGLAHKLYLATSV
jgi:hypothetical protein